jgi:glycine/D-amino acid oxidase-like deaminating enzyme
MTASHSTDIVVFGGGIAGLWLLNRLRDEGYNAILLEADGLGAAQTLASQGIIHGGLKYALGGSVTDAANTIAALPARWRACFDGTGEIDLSSCEVLSERYYMWSSASYRSKIKAFFGSKSLQGRVQAVPRDEFPPFFAEATVEGSLYALPDFAVDTPSLLSVLRARYEASIFKVDPRDIRFTRDASGCASSVTLRAGTGIGEAVRDAENDTVSIDAQRMIFCAGKGNQALIDAAGMRKPASQLRPLNMVWVKKAGLGSVFAHCIGEDFSLTPKLTVTTHLADDGMPVWYLGGEIAESGVGVPDDELIERAKRLIADLFPWVDLSGAQWGCFAIDRAEAKMADGSRPDGALFIAEDGYIAAWPTKLTLTPALADGVLAELAASVTKQAGDGMPTLEALAQIFPKATLAKAHWDR